MARRCICGASSRFPVCDGSHGGQRWSCAQPAPREVEQLFVAGVHLANLAERLAFEHGGLAAHRHPGPLRARQLVVLSDGTDIHEIQSTLDRIDAEATRVVALGVPASALRAAFPGAPVEAAPDGEGAAVVGPIQSLLTGAASAAASPPSGTLFVSHAVADEGTLQPAVDLLRGSLHLDVFACADSIPSGARWRDEIEGALRSAERFVLVVSRHSVASTWCAFEAGYALALGKPVTLISLDGSPPPGFLSHLQMQDLPRTVGRRPWMSPEEALLDAFLSAYADTPG